MNFKNLKRNVMHECLCFSSIEHIAIISNRSNYFQRQIKVSIA